MSQLLKSLECSFSEKKCLQECLRQRNVPQMIQRALDDHSPTRSELGLCKTTVLVSRVASIKTNPNMSLITALEHLEMAKRCIFCCMEYSEAKEPKDDGVVGAAAPTMFVPATESDDEMIAITRSIIKCMVGAVCGEVEKEMEEMEQGEDLDADAIYEFALDSNKFRGRRLLYFLVGCLLQLDRTYLESRVWLIYPIWKALTDDLLPSVGNKLPMPLRHKAIELLCTHLMDGIHTTSPDRTHQNRILRFFLSKLDCFKTINKTVMSTVTQVRGSLGIESPLAQPIQDLVVSKGSTKFVDIDCPADTKEELWYVGRLLLLLDSIQGKPNQDTDTIVQEIVLRTLPKAASLANDAMQRKLVVHALRRLAIVPIDPVQWISILCLSFHPLSIELCQQILASWKPGLLLAADLCCDARTSQKLLERLTDILLRALGGKVRISLVKERLQEGFRKMCSNKSSVSKTFCATIAPVLLHFRVDAPTSKLPSSSPLGTLCSILHGKTLTNFNGRYNLVLSLHLSIWLCRSRASDFSTHWNQINEVVKSAASAEESNSQDMVRTLLIELLKVLGPAVPDGAGLKDVARAFHKLLEHSDWSVRAAAITSLTEFAHTIPPKLKKILHKCLPKAMSPLMQARLEGKLMRKSDTPIDVLRKQHMRQFTIPPRGPDMTVQLDCDSYMLKLTTESGNTCWVVFPPGDGSLEDIRTMKQGNDDDDEEESPILQVTSIKGYTKGCQVQARRVANS